MNTLQERRLLKTVNSTEMGVFLQQNGVYDALQFINSAYETILIACTCKDLIINISEEINTEHFEWRDNLKWVPTKENAKVSRLEITAPPSFEMEVAEVQINKFFFRDFLIKDFFQYCRNSFDLMAQIANAACLAFCALKIEKVDFPQLLKEIEKGTEIVQFQNLCNWITKVNSAPEYQYINMYCNRTKHTCGIKTRTELPIFGSEKAPTINPFYRLEKDSVKQNEKKEIVDTVCSLYQFVSSSYSEFMAIIEAEVPKKSFVDNRYYTVQVYQQYINNSLDNSFSLAYLAADKEIDKMPDEIQVLFVSEPDRNGRVLASNCPFNTIYIKKTKEPDLTDFFGKYIAEDEVGVDDLLRFRKYKKEISQEGETPVHIQAMTDVKQKDTFYHNNPFFTLHTVSDDEDFVRRSALPF